MSKENKLDILNYDFVKALLQRIEKLEKQQTEDYNNLYDTIKMLHNYVFMRGGGKSDILTTMEDEEE